MSNCYKTLVGCACFLMLACGAAAQNGSAPERDAKTGVTGNPQDLLLKAFPGAEGYGAYAGGGRGGRRRSRVLFVTNLEDYNEGAPPIEGSLREAVEEGGSRYILFRVAGNLRLKRPLEIKNGNVTIAGQSAPGDGVCLVDGSLNVAAPHVIIRHLRCRRGDRQPGQSDAISITDGAQNVILDHCTASWSIDETLSATGSNTDRVTVQWCLISESLNESKHAKGAHGYGSLVRMDGRVSFHHNLYAHHSGRNPRVGGYSRAAGQVVDFRNNVVYNWGNTPSYTGTQSPQFLRYNFVNNYYKPGPSTKTKGYILDVQGFSYLTQIHVAGNWLEGVSREGDAGGWELAQLPANLSAEQLDHLKREYEFDPWRVTTEPAREIFDPVLAGAGATLPARDAADARVVEQVRACAGRIINSQDDVGGWPQLAAAEKIADADDDGMPDLWETAHGLDPSSSRDTFRDEDDDGYSNLEEFLNGTDPRRADLEW